MNHLLTLLKEAMDNTKIDPLLLIATFLLDFECVYPFKEGNLAHELFFLGSEQRIYYNYWAKVREATMELRVTYTHFDIAKISIFDELETNLKDCLAEFGFELTDADFDFETGERSLNFINEEWLSKFEDD